MDILVSSNLERLIYTLGGAEMTKDLMEQLSRKGKYTAPDSLMFEIRKYFSAYSLDEDETKEEIRETWEGDGYLIDPHTAVGLGCGRKFRLRGREENNSRLHRKPVQVRSGSMRRYRMPDGRQHF